MTRSFEDVLKVDYFKYLCLKTNCRNLNLTYLAPVHLLKNAHALS